MSSSFPDLTCSDRTLVMGVVNVTPDSFSDGGQHDDTKSAVAHGLRLIGEGADTLDIGGESTAPDSRPVSEEEESARVLPVVEQLASRGIAVSVDTWKASVAERALEAGAWMINDVTALRGGSQMAEVLARRSCPVTIMYAKDPTPRTTPRDREYGDVVAEIIEFLRERLAFAASRGIARDRIVIDPGMGAFVSGSPEPSLEILKRLGEFTALGQPVLVGASRKGFIGKVLDLPIDERVEGSVACAAIAVWNGARIVRVHDVRETARTVRMVDAIRTGHP